MIRLDLKRKIAIIDNLTSLDQVIMFISSHDTNLNNWEIMPYSMIQEQNNEIEDEDIPPNISDFF